MQSKNASRFLSLLVVVSLLLSTRLVAHASTPEPATPAANPANLAWFYKPPADGNLPAVANNFNTYIMTKGNEATRDQLLTPGANQPVWEYLRFEAIMDPGSCTAKPWQNQVANQIGDFCNISSQHPDWFLLTTSGARITHMTGSTKFLMMDPGNPGWRAFFLERVSQILAADPVWDGVFLDNVEETNSFHIDAGEDLAAYPDNASFQAAVQGFLQYLSVNYFKPQGKQLLANLISRGDDADFTNYLTYLDGVMHEGWAIDDPDRWRPAATWEKHMALAEQTQAMGKNIILVSHGAQDDLELQQFAFASYLLIVDGRATFRYASSAAYNQAWLYDNYQVALGAPLGCRYQSGSAWKRDFTNGSVSVDPNSHAVSIKVNSGATATATGLPATATKLPPTVTSLPATATKLPPTATSLPATATKLPPTATGLPATATKLPPTATKIPATVTATKQPPTGTPTQTSGTPTYDNKNTGMIYTADWSTVNDNQATNGSYAQTRTLNGSVSFKFTGTSFSFLYLAQPNGGTFKLFIDGKYYHYISQKSSDIRYQKPWKLNSADTLSPGQHTLTLVFDNPAGTVVTFDQFTVTQP